MANRMTSASTVAFGQARATIPTMTASTPRRISGVDRDLSMTDLLGSGGVLCGPPLAPDVADQRAVAGQVGGGPQGPELHGPALAVLAMLAAGVPHRLMRRPLADGEDERVGDGPHQLAVPVVIVVRLRGRGFGGGFRGLHGVPSFIGRTSIPCWPVMAAR